MLLSSRLLCSLTVLTIWASQPRTKVERKDMSSSNGEPAASVSFSRSCGFLQITCTVNLSPPHACRWILPPTALLQGTPLITCHMVFYCSLVMHCNPHWSRIWVKEGMTSELGPSWYPHHLLCYSINFFDTLFLLPFFSILKIRKPPSTASDTLLLWVNIGIIMIATRFGDVEIIN